VSGWSFPRWLFFCHALDCAISFARDFFKCVLFTAVVKDVLRASSTGALSRDVSKKMTDLARRRKMMLQQVLQPGL
jgi:hypothetical protein